MKSFRIRYQCLPLVIVAPPLSFIDDTKVRHIPPGAKDKNLYLLNGNIFRDIVDAAIIIGLLTKMPGFCFQKHPAFLYFVEKNQLKPGKKTENFFFQSEN